MKLLIVFLKPVDSLAALVNTLVLIAAFGLIFLHPNLPAKLPLWFSLSWGEQRLAPTIFLWLLPALIFVFFLISHLAAKRIQKRQIVVARILVWSTAFISFVFLLALYKIILLVT